MTLPMHFYHIRGSYSNKEGDVTIQISLNGLELSYSIFSNFLESIFKDNYELSSNNSQNIFLKHIGYYIFLRYCNHYTIPSEGRRYSRYECHFFKEDKSINWLYVLDFIRLNPLVNIKKDETVQFHYPDSKDKSISKPYILDKSQLLDSIYRSGQILISNSANIDSEILSILETYPILGHLAIAGSQLDMNTIRSNSTFQIASFLQSDIISVEDKNLAVRADVLIKIDISNLSSVPTILLEQDFSPNRLINYLHFSYLDKALDVDWKNYSEPEISYCLGLWEDLNSKFPNLFSNQHKSKLAKKANFVFQSNPSLFNTILSWGSSHYKDIPLDLILEKLPTASGFDNYIDSLSEFANIDITKTDNLAIQYIGSNNNIETSNIDQVFELLRRAKRIDLIQKFNLNQTNIYNLFYYTNDSEFEISKKIFLDNISINELNSNQIREEAKFHWIAEQVPKCQNLSFSQWEAFYKIDNNILSSELNNYSVSKILFKNKQVFKYLEIKNKSLIESKSQDLKDVEDKYQELTKNDTIRTKDKVLLDFKHIVELKQSIPILKRTLSTLINLLIILLIILGFIVYKYYNLNKMSQVGKKTETMLLNQNDSLKMKIDSLRVKTKIDTIATIKDSIRLDSIK